MRPLYYNFRGRREGMGSVGETLRQQRVRKHLTLEQVSRETKISGRMLEAIENEQFERLPGGVFAKSFVRQYARMLGLDEDEMAAEVDRVMQSDSGTPAFAHIPASHTIKVPKMPRQSRPGSSPWASLAMTVAVILLCSGIYMWWQSSRRPAPVASAPSAAAVAASPAPESKPAKPPTQTVAARREPAPDQPSPDQAARGTADQEQREQAPNPAAVLHVSVSADAETWVRAWADGNQVMTATLEPGVTKTVDAVGEIRLRTGNAGDLQVTVNGKPAGPIGPRGQIRIVTVTPKGVQIEAPPKPEPAPAPLPVAPAPEPL
jgi:cytoskeleton protein RodZ